MWKGSERVAEKEQGVKKQGAVPWWGQEVGVGEMDFVTCSLGMLTGSGEGVELCCHLHNLHSASLHLHLIGFNEWFNKTALPDQIKLLLSTAFNPGSLLCNARETQKPPQPPGRPPPHTFSPSSSAPCLFILPMQQSWRCYHRSCCVCRKMLLHLKVWTNLILAPATQEMQ